jgi:hypothetical protein
MDIIKVAVLPQELEAGCDYATRSKGHTLRKLEFQQSQYSNLERNIIVGRVARDVIARVLGEADIKCRFEDTPPTQWKSFSIATLSGRFIQPRSIGDYPRHTKLPDDVRSFEKRPHEFYVAVTSRDKLVTLDVLGWATRHEMGERKPISFGYGVLNRYVPLDRLHPFAELMQLLQSDVAAQQAALPVRSRAQRRA